jgi:hypothetical protein
MTPATYSPLPSCSGRGTVPADRDPVTDPRTGDEMVTRGGERAEILERGDEWVTWRGWHWGRGWLSPETVAVAEWRALAEQTRRRYGLGTVRLAGAEVPGDDP